MALPSSVKCRGGELKMIWKLLTGLVEIVIGAAVIIAFLFIGALIGEATKLLIGHPNWVSETFFSGCVVIFLLWVCLKLGRRILK